MKLCNFEVANNLPFFLISGPCTAESEMLCLDVAGQLKEICQKLKINYIFKASYDKANRSSGASKRGPGIDTGLKYLQSVQQKIGVPVLTDVHEISDISQVASVVDVLQTPAFLCRQTDFICAVAACGKPVNIKKGQFLAPEQMQNVVAKAKSANANADNIMVCERGYSFGYNNLVVDFRGIPIMQSFGYPVVFDATHSVQLPGANGSCSGGDRRFVPYLAKAAMAVGANVLFFEVHPDPEKALCDGPNMIALKDAKKLFSTCKKIFELVKE